LIYSTKITIFDSKQIIMQETLADKIMKRADAAVQIQYLQETFEAEKERRIEFREWLNPDVKAEFINGEIIIHSPVKKQHWSASGLLSTLLTAFTNLHKLGKVGVEKVMITLTRNDYEPDLVFFSREKAEQFTDDQVLFPAPDLVVEILSKRTAKKDKTTKKDDYAYHGVREYWIIDASKQKVYQYILPTKNATEYFPAKVVQYGEYLKSVAVEGFEIPTSAIFDEEINVKVLRELISGS